MRPSFPSLTLRIIAIDDLRPELGCYGPELAVTPNIDKLASRVAFSSGFPLCLATFCKENPPFCKVCLTSLLM